MIVTTNLVSFIAASAATFVFASGYIFGARRGASARRAIDAERLRELARATTAETRMAGMAQATDEAAALRSGLEAAVRESLQTQNDGSVRALRGELHELTSSLLERELRRIVGPLLERQNDTRGLKDMMQKALSPFLERERLGQELARLEGGSTLVALPQLLDAIADKGGFSSVVLSDDVGLPLAASSNAQSVDWLAGVASLLLTLVERSERCGEPRPIGVVVHDESNQRILHRIFTVSGERFLLTAVSRQDVSPSALDPALGKLERALARDAQRL